MIRYIIAMLTRLVAESISKCHRYAKDPSHKLILLQSLEQVAKIFFERKPESKLALYFLIFRKERASQNKCAQYYYKMDVCPQQHSTLHRHLVEHR